MLNCCVDLEAVKSTGITFATFACLAKCQGLDVDAVYGSNSTVDDFRGAVRRVCTEPTSSDEVARPTSFLVVSYDRRVLGQTGSGHFSPVGAYDESSDSVLVLDTARFKYGPHWVPLPSMFDALLPVDSGTGRSRGYAVVGYEDDATRPSILPLSVLFGSKKSKDFLRREYKEYLRGLIEEEGNAGNGITLASVVSFWAQNETRLWELVEPQLRPVDSADVWAVESVRRLARGLLLANEHYASVISQDMLETPRGDTMDPPVGECCNNSTPSAVGGGRLLEISPAEVMYVVYLASLPPDVQRALVYAKLPVDDAAPKVDDDAREQLLAEAALISFAIETCDVDV